MYKLAIIFIFLMAVGAGAQTRIHFDIRTGDDNLEKMQFQHNPSIVIRLRDGTRVVRNHINRGMTWPNDSMRRVTIDLPEGRNLSELHDFTLGRYSVGGQRVDWENFQKDNWTVKSIRVHAEVNEGGLTRPVDLLNLYSRGNFFRFVYDATDRRGEGQEITTRFTDPAAAPGGRVVTRNASITATFETGNDDLRGRGDNVGVVLKFAGSSMAINLDNLNQGMKWDNGTEKTVTKVIPNSTELDLNSISEVEVRHMGGSSNDEWSMSKVKIVINKLRTRGEDEARILVNNVGTADRLVHKFTSRSRVRTFTALGSRWQTALQNVSIKAEFETGGDDLRGGSRDNLDLYIKFRDGSETLVARNLNRGQGWGNNSRNTVTVEIPNSDGVKIDEISEIELRHTGGYTPYDSQDNWDLVRFKLTVNKGNRSLKVVDLVRVLIHRFSGNERSKIFTVN